MKAFLSKEEVKQYIYNIIFDKTDDMALFKKKSFKEKFKIVASGRKDEDMTEWVSLLLVFFFFFISFIIVMLIFIIQFISSIYKSSFTNYYN